MLNIGKSNVFGKFVLIVNKRKQQKDTFGPIKNTLDGRETILSFDCSKPIF